MTTLPKPTFCNRTRREFLWESGGGFTGLALAGMLGQDGFLRNQSHAADGLTPLLNPLAPKSPYIGGQAKRVIFLFMYGGPSHIDTFEHKPKLYPLDGKTIPVKTFGRGGRKTEGRVVGPKWNFRQYGQCGKWVSDLFPNLAQCVDDMTFLHTMQAESPIHGSAMLMMNSGRLLSGSPCLGSWANYGLGSENQNLPGFVVMLDPTGGPISGAKNWSCGFMPATYQATVMRSEGSPILNLDPPASMSDAMQRRAFDTLRAYNEDHLTTRTDNSQLAARIASYELAYKMQQHAPEAVDLARETEATRRLYGMDDKRTSVFGRQCLLARRLVERGVRFVQLYAGGAHGGNNWDAHDDLVENHNYNAARTDKPIAGLLKDLKQRGLLEETLVVWGGEFGRQPTAEYAKGTGRDHNSYAFTMWMAGGGVAKGRSYGESDQLGAQPASQPIHVRRLHATILHLLGFDPNALAFFHGGLNHRLIGVEETQPIFDILA